MGRGLVLGAMGKAVGNIGATVSDMMVRDISDRQRREDREREKEEDREFRAEQARLQREAVAERQASRGGSGGGGGGGMSNPPLENVAGLAGMTAPEMEAYDKAQKTGDFSAFKTAQREDDAGPSKYDPKEFDQARATYPPGITDETIRAKFKQIAEIRTAMAMGKDNDDYQKGNRVAQEIDASKRAEADPEKAGIIGQAIAVGKGADIIGGDGNVTRNKFTGDTSVTPVGQSVIRENNAQGAAAGGNAKAETLKALREERVLATSATAEAAREVKALEASSKDAIGPKAKEAHAASLAAARAKLKAAEDERSDVAGRLRQYTDNGKLTPPTPARAAPAAGKKNYQSLWK